MDEFYVLAQLSITIAGFAALFSILKPSKIEWTDLDKLNLVRFYVMIEMACLISIYSFLPIILLGFLNEETSFRISFGFGFLTWPIYLLYIFKRNKRFSGKIAIGGLSSAIMQAIGISVILYCLIGSLNYLGNNYKTNYLISIFIFFIIDLWLFIRLIYGTIRKN